MLAEIQGSDRRECTSRGSKGRWISYESEASLVHRMSYRAGKALWRPCLKNKTIEQTNELRLQSPLSPRTLSLTHCYNLMYPTCCAGRNKQATELQSRYSEQRLDPGSGSYCPDFQHVTHTHVSAQHVILHCTYRHAHPHN